MPLWRGMPLAARLPPGLAAGLHRHRPPLPPPPAQNVHRVSLKKLPYTVVRLPGQAAGEAAAGGPIAQVDGPADAGQQQAQQGQEGSGDDDGSEGGSDDEEGSSGSEEEAEEQPQRRPGRRAANGTGGGGSESEEDDDKAAAAAEAAAQAGSEDDDDEEGEEEAALDAFPAATGAAVEAFAAAVEADPAAFLQPSAQLAALAKSATKALYDYQAVVDAEAGGSGKRGAAASQLPELYVEGFDAEQIWLQLELGAAPALRRARKLLKKVGQQPRLMTEETEEAIDGGWGVGEGGAAAGWALRRCPLLLLSLNWGAAASCLRRARRRCN